MTANHEINNRKRIKVYILKANSNTMENTQKSKVENTTNMTEHSQVDQGLALSVQKHHHGATDLVAPGPVLEASFYKSLDYHQPMSNNDIVAYLSRPQPLAQGTITNGSFAPFYTKTFLPSDFVADLANVRGALGYRATVCFRVEITATPQVQGIIRAAYEYMPPNTVSPKNTFRPISCQLPGAEINLRSNSALEVKVPFVFDRDFWFYINGTYSSTATAFNFTVWPYSAVSWDPTVTSRPNYVIYKWFEDVEFISKSCPTVAVTPQSKMPEKRVGRVTSWFQDATKLATYAGTIPSLSSIALPVSWAFDAFTKVSAHYGWSKPSDGSYSMAMLRSTARGINTCADTDFANPMGYYANNEVECLPGFAGNDYDEMSICYLTCKPGLIAQTKLRTTDSRDRVKWVTPVSPSNFVFQSSENGFAQLSSMGLGTTTAVGVNKAGFLPSPIAFCASYFDRWRGDLIFRFKFTTTKFHSGKLLIGYVPGEDVSDGGATAGGFSQAPNNTTRFDFHSAVIDLRNTEEYDFRVPFTYPAAWCDTGMRRSVAGNFGTRNTGSVFVKIVEPLTAPANVAQDVVMLVEVLSDCGLELSQPITSQYATLTPTQQPVLIAQSQQKADFDATRYVSGERILSLKQLAMRPMWFSRPLTGGQRVITEAHIDYAYPAEFVPVSGKYNQPLHNHATILSNLSCLYALTRGSIIARMIPARTDDSEPPNDFKARFMSYVTWAVSGTTDARSAAQSVEFDSVNMVKIPFYAANNRCRTGWSSLYNISGGAPAVNRSLLIGPPYPDFQNVGYGICAADDYQLGAFTGVPPCVTLDTSIQTVPNITQTDLFFTNVQED